MSLASAAQPLHSLPLPAARSRLANAVLALSVAGLLLVAAALRVVQLDHVPGINGDEAWYGIQAMRLLNAEDVAWRTPTNNILNPFFFVPLSALHLIAAPSAALLRLPAVMSGLLALALNYVLCRRTFDRPTTLTSTLFLAVLPVNIAYSRFGWDTSQTLLATLPAVYLPLLAAKEPQYRQRWLMAAAMAFVASLIVHPTNIFTAPLLAIPLVWVGRRELQAALIRPRQRWQWTVLGFLLAASLAGIAWLGRHWLAVILGRLAMPAQLGEFAWHYERLFSGLTVYRFIAGSNLPGPGTIDVLPLDLAWWAILSIAALGIVNRFRRPVASFAWIEGCLVVGWGTMLLGFFLVAGPGAIAPHYERYALCLLAPAAVVWGRGIAWWLTRAETRIAATSAMLAVGWLTLLGFQQHYFEFIHRTGGGSHATFRTASAEPKQQVLAEILQARDPEQVSWIVTAEYWNEKPLLYLAAGVDQLRVENWTASRESPELRAAVQEGRAWFVEFAGSAACQEVREYLSRQQRGYRESTIEDYAGQSVLVLFCPGS